MVATGTVIRQTPEMVALMPVQHERPRAEQSRGIGTRSGPDAPAIGRSPTHFMSRFVAFSNGTGAGKSPASTSISFIDSYPCGSKVRLN